jgi:adenosylmethionine-8-amino-7-oxononanoate aminotransferase
MTPNLLVLGTDTDAGKTTFSLLFLAAFADRYDYWKPVETGESDSEAVRRSVPTAVVHPPLARFRDPVAPPLAARREGRVCPSADAILAAMPATDRGLLIETFGGPLSPLNDDELQIELIRRLGARVVLVASSAVGAVGRTLQCVDALAGHGVGVDVVVLVGPRDGYAESEIRKHRPGVRVVGLTPPATRGEGGWAAAAREQRPQLDAILAAPRVAKQQAAEDLLAVDRRCVWHPYTSLRAADPLPVAAADAEFLHLADGRKLVDAISSWWTTLHGHRHPPLMAALREASESFDHVLFAGVTHPSAVRFAGLILRTCPWVGGRVFYSDNGSTAVEVALKMAYQFWCHRGEPHRTLFVGFEDAYHGDTFGAMAVGRDRLFFGAFEPLLFRAAQLPLDPDRLDDFLAERSNEVAAVIVEPLIQGAGGMRMHSPGTLRDLFAAATRHGVPVIADEVMTGNRTGRRWAFQHAGVAPDLICASKTLAGGVLPLAVTLAGPEVVAAFDTADRTKTFFHGHSFTAHPLACAVAAVNEELIAQPGVLERADVIGRTFADRWADLRDHPRVVDVRILGNVAAVEVRAGGGYLAAEAERWKQLAVERGVFLRPLGNVLYTMPPLNTAADSLDRVAEVVREAVGSDA